MTTRPVRALFVNRDLDFHGGVPQTLLTLARHRDISRMDMHLATMRRPSSEMAVALAETGVPVFQIPDSYHRGLLSLRSLVRQHSIDVVVGCSFKSYLLAKGASAGNQARPVFWIHGIPLIIQGRTRQALFHRLARNDTLIFISEAVREAYDFAEHDGESIVVYNGVEQLRSAGSGAGGCALRKRFGIPGDATLLGYTASFIGWKRHIDLIRAVSLLVDEYPDLHVVLIGTGDMQESARRRADDLGVGDRVHFTGAVTNARDLLRMIDLYVHPADGEGFGLAIVEAMLAGVPVIGADAGAIPELVRDGETGLLFAAGNPEALADRVRQALAAPEMLRGMAATAATDATRAFSARLFADRITDVVEAEARPTPVTHVSTVGVSPQRQERA